MTDESAYPTFEQRAQLLAAGYTPITSLAGVKFLPRDGGEPLELAAALAELEQKQ